MFEAITQALSLSKGVVANFVYLTLGRMNGEFGVPRVGACLDPLIGWMAA